MPLFGIFVWLQLIFKKNWVILGGFEVKVGGVGVLS